MVQTGLVLTVITPSDAASADDDAAPATEVNPTANKAVKISAFTFFNILTPSFYCIITYLEYYDNTEVIKLTLYVFNKSSTKTIV